MEEHHYISTELLTISKIKEILEYQQPIALSEEAILNINKSHDYLQHKIKDNETPIYGINTGFGSLCDVRVSSDNLSKLQENLVMSHACGTGERVPESVVKVMLLLKIQSLSYGHSGVQLQTVNRLIEFFNHDIFRLRMDVQREGVSDVLDACGQAGEGGIKMTISSGRLL